MTSPYLDLVASLRQAFPQPVSDRVHDAYFVFSFLRALDQLDAMKSVSPLLGQPASLDYEAARLAKVEDGPRPLEQVTQTLVDHLSGMFIWGHPRAQINVIPPPTIASVIGGLLPSIYNPNLCSEESSRQVAVAEVEVSSMTASLVGYDPQKSAGLFTFGGTATLLYGVKLGLEKACPGSGRAGLRGGDVGNAASSYLPPHGGEYRGGEPIEESSLLSGSSPPFSNSSHSGEGTKRGRPVILCSEQAHYACLSAANWLGIGQENVIQVPCDDRNEIRPCLLESMARDILKSGGRIAAIVATMGTTDHFGLDDLAAIHDVRERLVDEFRLDYRPHIHADAVIGWAWSVFNDYDFGHNPLGFRHRTVRALAGAKRRIERLSLADSIGIDFHKTGFCPYVSTLFLVKDAANLELISRKQSDTPYLFHDGHYHPGRYTLETSRSGSGALAALANLRLFGKNGLRSLLGHVVSMAEALREHLEGRAATTVCNRGNFGPVTLFRVYPDDVDTFTILEREQKDAAYRDRLLAHNDYNRRVFQLVQQDALKGEGVVISLTDCYRESDYGEPMVALKSYILSPFAEEQYIDAVLQSLWKARAVIAEQSRSDGAHG